MAKVAHAAVVGGSCLAVIESKKDKIKKTENRTETKVQEIFNFRDPKTSDLKGRTALKID